ncbi:AraC family transcriptional regulator [Chryseobacterium sp. Y16C]|uniref:helix-turn-helix domain-containing protein n=1 Tax=Chryseobacterium sp. Y16C TaxID=2920939 RepID=UPI001F0AAC7F|nr:AraC family transcriptional regulator [Chryseobacterium sp. Y16C]UMQ42352.1 AraC family transcriptional regulator [Chryseobacterium sp. Y16C]
MLLVSQFSAININAMRKYFYLFLIIFSSFTTFSSQNIEESQKNIIDRYNKIEMDDTEEANIDEIKKLYEQSKKLNFSEGILRGLLVQQSVAATQKKYTLSAKYGNEAEGIAEQVQNYKALSNISKLRGYIDMMLDKYPEAEVHLNTSASYAEKIENKVERHIALCSIYMNLAGMYEGLEKPEKVLESLKKSLQYIETVPVDKLDKYQKNTYYYLYISGLQSMGGYYIIRKPHDLDRAELYLKRVLDFQNTAPKYFKGNETSIYRSLCGLYFEKGEYQKSLDYSFKFLQAEKTQKDPVARWWVYNKMKDDYKFLKNTDEEIKYTRLSTALNDSLTYAEKKAIITLSRDQIKKADIKNNQKMSNLLWIGGVIIILMMLGTWLLINKKNKALRKKYEQMMLNLKSEKKDQVEEIDEATDHDNIVEKSSEDLQATTNKNTISADTETRILKKLASFEKSEKYLKKDLTISSLAAQLNTNTKYLSEVIKNNTSQNFNHYINSLRINYIVHKLYNEPKYREYKISYLAEECGFASSQVFVIAFKKENGLPPSYFIQNLKEDKVNITVSEDGLL